MGVDASGQAGTAVEVERLRAQLERFEQLLEQLPSAVVIAETPSGRLVYANPLVWETFGRPPGPLSETVEGYGEDWVGFHADGRRVAAEEWPLARALRHGEVVTDEEVTIERGDGSHAWISIRASPVRDADGAIVAAVASFGDVTARKRAEQEAYAANERVIGTLEAMGDAFFHLDDDWRFTYVNGSAERLLQRTRCELLGRNVWEEFPEAVESPFWTHYHRARAQGATVSFEAFYSPLGSWFDVAAHPGADGLAVYFHDASERRQLAAAEEEIARRESAERVVANVGDGVALLDLDGVVQLWNPAAEAITGVPAAAAVGRWLSEIAPGWPSVSLLGETPHTLPLEVAGRGEAWVSVAASAFGDGVVVTLREVTIERRLERMRSEFVATVSHELRTPLAAVTGAALTLARPEVLANDRTREQLVALIGDESARLTRLVSDILTVGNLDAGSLRIDRAPTDPREPVRAAVEALRRRLPETHRIELKEREVPRVAVDGDRLQQVVANLLDNAVKYSPGGAVAVEVARNDGHVRIAVSDEGFGIPRSERERVFDKFFRLDPDHARGAGGSGLGLYVSRELVRRMDGRLAIEERAGPGTTFVVELPAL